MNEHLNLASCCIVTIVFAASALGKARAPQEFAVAVREMRVAPERLTGRIVVTVPALEAALALAVWVPVVSAWAFALAIGLTAAFTVVLVSVIRRRIDTSCSCFGVSAAPVGSAHIVRNCALFAVTVTGFLSALLRNSAAPYLPPLPDVFINIFVAACISIFIIATDVLVEVFTRSPRTTAGNMP